MVRKDVVTWLLHQSRVRSRRVCWQLDLKARFFVTEGIKSLPRLVLVAHLVQITDSTT